MDYYIQGNKKRADEINAAFKKLGYDTSRHLFNAESVLYFTLNSEIRATTCNCTPAIIKTHPNYQELELPTNPKFKLGDWIVQNDNGTVSQITKVINGTDEYGEYHAYEHTNGYFAACFENEFHLWTIQDAMDGDVLVTTKIRSCPLIYRKTSYKNNLAYCYVGIDGNGNLTRSTLCHFGSASDVVPATKEQRDQLFFKIKKEGYEWDAEKKELKKFPKHYDISSFHAGMPVLVRNMDGEQWTYTTYSHYDSIRGYKFMTSACQLFVQCIPFNDDTKHLLGTTDMPSEEYINW